MKAKLLASFLITALLTPMTSVGHHSYAATYDVNETVTLNGELVRFQLRAPHSYVYMQTEGEDGEMQRWTVEWSAPSNLSRQGISRDSLRNGDEVILTVRPSRVRGEFRALMLTLERPSDGLSWGRNPDEVVD